MPPWLARRWVIVQSGRQDFGKGQVAFHIVDPVIGASYAQRLEQAGIPMAELEKSGQFELHTWLEAYLRDGEFDLDAMLALVEEILQRFPRVRIVGHMNFPDARKT